MTIPSEISRLLIFRAPLSEERIYSVFSDDRSYSVEVMFARGDSGLEWILTFTTSSGITKAPMAVNGQIVMLTKGDGTSCGMIKEAWFSFAGKTIVEDETGKVIGWLIPKMTGARFFSAEGQELGVAKLHRKEELPMFLREEKAHLASCYILERTNTLSFDERLIFCFVCNLVSQEHQTSAG